MSKARDNTSEPNIAANKGRHWVRKTTKTPSQAEAGTKTRKRQRFVEPYRLSDEQRAAMLIPLERLGIGDEETRSLFSAALEYDLASCRDTIGQAEDAATDPEPPSPGPEDLHLSALHHAAQALADSLKALDEAPKTRLQQALKDSDRFRRSYDDEYFSMLRYELLRLAAVAKPVQQPEPPAKPLVSESARQFVVRAADAFEECFDTKATARVNGPFLLTLKAIVTAIGIRIPTDAGSVATLLKTT